MTDNRLNEKAILLFVIVFLAMFIVYTLRLIVDAGDGQASSFYRLMTVIMLALLAVSVYGFVKS